MCCPGVQVGVEVRSGDSERHVDVPAGSQPMQADGIINRIGSMAVSILFLTLGVLIGFRQPSLKGYRALSFAFAMLGLGDLARMWEFLPPWIPVNVADAVYGLGLPAVLYFAPVFAVYFPDDRPEGLHAFLRRWALPLQGACCVALVLMMLAEALGYFVPIEDEIQLVPTIGRSLIIFAAFVAGWSGSKGHLSLRYKWLTVSIGLWTVLSALTPLPLEVGGWSVTAVLYPPGVGLALLLLSYAALRHQVLDLHFVVNRAAVYTATSAVLLVSFGLLEWLAEHLLPFEGREQNMVLDAGLALAVFLTFHRVRNRVEHWVENLLFH
jgi:hypothetical protein